MKLRHALIAATAVTTLTAAVPLTAHAVAGCTTAMTYSTEWMRCTIDQGPTHQYRVVGKMTDGHGSYLTKWGPWVGIGSTSLVSVPLGYKPYYVGGEFR